MDEIVKLRRQLRGRLLDKGWTIKEWGAAKGYRPGVVGNVISDYVGLDEYPATGTQAKQVIDALEKETGLTLCG